jgi:hypothetical protein
MRRTTTTLALLLLAAGAWVWWLAAESQPLAVSRTGTDASATRAAVPQAIEPTAAQQTDAAKGAQLAIAASGSQPIGRDVGIEAPPPDTLVAICGQVLDAKTRQPLANFKLSFLSTRPRTVEVVTDDEGRFHTEPALAPGLVSVMHTADPDHLRYMARWDLDPPQFFLPRMTADQVWSLDLAAQAPSEVLEVDVVMPEGDPASGAAVTLTGGRRDERGSFAVEVRDLETADLQGRARFALFGAGVLDRMYLVEAEHLGAYSSDLLVIDGALGARARRLDLFPAGVITIHARNEEGRPLANVSLYVSCEDSGTVVRGHHALTDANGEAIIAPLRAACWTVSATHPLTGRTLSRTVDLPRGASKEVDFLLGVGGLRLAASGTVVDEVGYPLGGVTVHAKAGTEEPVALVTSDNGVFAFWAKPAEHVVLSVGGGWGDDIYDPALSELPFGVAGLAVVRRAKLETRSLPFVVVDAHSGKSVRKASIVLQHPSQHFAALGAVTMRFGAANGVTHVSWKRRDDVRYTVDAPGYLRAEGRLSDLLEECGEWGPLRVDLKEGFDRELEVIDRATRRGIAKVQVREGTQVIGTTDAQGRLRVRAAAWPEALRLDAPGYRATVWLPAEAEHPGTVIVMEPVRILSEGQ